MAGKKPSKSAREKAKKRVRRRWNKNENLRGTGLTRDKRTGILHWRRVDPETGKRPPPRSTGTHVLRYALQKAREWDDEFERKKAGIKVYNDWTKPLRPQVDEWTEARRGEPEEQRPGEPWLAQERSAVLRALEELELRTAADLTHLGRLDAKLKSLGLPESKMRRRYQEPLMRFSAWLAGNHRHLERDPLASWEPITYARVEKHRCLDPHPVARALIASDWLDEIHGRDHRLRPAFTVLLVTMPRVSALTTRDAGDYLRNERRIYYGVGRKKKLRGQGKLDDSTAEELEAYLGDRVRGPLLLSPRERRIAPGRLLHWWKEAFGLGVLLKLWPEGEPWCVETAHLVNQVLLTGHAPVGRGGNPNVVHAETKREIREHERLILRKAEALREAWTEAMERVTVHSFRHTHETWALAAGVDQVLINLQGGWKVSRTREDFDVKRIRASMTGLERYADSRSKVLDCRKSAVAVRAMLDQALQEVEEELRRGDILPASAEEAAGTNESHGAQRRA